MYAAVSVKTLWVGPLHEVAPTITSPTSIRETFDMIILLNGSGAAREIASEPAAKSEPRRSAKAASLDRARELFSRPVAPRENCKVRAKCARAVSRRRT
jgi:hypothetical protein